MSKELFYDTIAESFEDIANQFDTDRRVEVLFEDLLQGDSLSGKKLLDAGCGFGAFTKKALEQGAEVYSMDLSPKLVDIVQKKYPDAKGVVGSVLEIPFPENHFDIVLSSEVIEHTPEPLKAIEEFIRVCKNGGDVVVSCPNKTTWHFSLKIAQAFKLRAYQGLENWQPYFGLRKWLKRRKDISLKSFQGIHLLPFLFKWTYPINRFVDKRLPQSLGWLKVNLAFHLRKQ